MTDVAAGPRVRRAVKYGAWPLVALAFTVFLESGERSALSIAIDGKNGLKAAFGISDFAAGLLPFAMSAVGLIGSVPMGALADRVKRTRLLAIATAIWSACMALGGLATSYASLFVSRLGVGMVEATGPASTSLLSDYYPVEERAKRMGLYNLGALVGAIVGYGGVGAAVAAGGWRWAFWFWLPLGIGCTFVLLRQPEPVRGDQERDFSDDIRSTATVTAADEQSAEVLADVDLEVLERIALPEPDRTGTFDYATGGWREVIRELWQIRSMWYAVFGIAVAQLLINAIAFWAIPYFERVHHLAKAKASGLAGLLALSSVIGFLIGGYLSDRYFRRGLVNARIYLAAVGCVVGAAFLMVGFASTTLLVTGPFFFLGGLFLSIPVPPSDAMLTDVVVAPLRGRASTVRSIVRTVSAAGPPIVGLISVLVSHHAKTGTQEAADGLRFAIVVFCPIYAIGGLMMLRAAKHYPKDLAFVLAETRRLEALEVPGAPGALGDA